MRKSSKGETFGFVPAGRGGAFGAARIGLVGTFWNILCCSNWAFCKVSSFNSYSCFVYCRILGGLELPWNGRITALLRAHRGQKSTGFFFPSVWWMVLHFLWPGAKFLNQNCLYQGTRNYINHYLKASFYFLAWNQKSLSFKQMVK